MRFAASITIMTLGQSLTGQSGRGLSSQARPRRSGHSYGRFILICLATAGFFYVFSEINETKQAPLPAESPSAASMPAWIEIPYAAPAFKVEAPEFGGNPRIYSARRHRAGGGREDVFDFGGSSENAPLLNLVIYQPGKEARPDSSFYVELARRAAETGRAIVRAEQPARLTTKFGAFDIAPLDLTRDGTARRPCLGFWFANTQSHLHITGFACGGGETLASPSALKIALTCVIDGIGLAPGSEDKGLVDFFAAHYAMPGPACPGPKMDSEPPRTLLPVKAGESPSPRSQRKSHQKTFN